MGTKTLRLLSVALLLIAGALAIWLWTLSASYPSTSTLFRRGYFLLDLLLGTATILQTIGLSAGGFTRASKIGLALGIFILLIGVAMAYRWISGR